MHEQAQEEFPNLKNLINIVKLSEYKAKKLQTEEKRRQELAEQFPHLFSKEKVTIFSAHKLYCNLLIVHRCLVSSNSVLNS